LIARSICERGVDLYRARMLAPSTLGPPTVFLLSPAKCGGLRGRMLVDGAASFPLALQLHSPAGATIGEVFAFLSALYFRGKLAYSRQFARVPRGEGVFVITPGAGLRPASERLGVERLQLFGEVDIHHENERYLAPLLRDARQLAADSDDDTRFVLLGSIASAKYLAPLLQVFGERLFFPKEFVGRGDMSRGGLLLRSAADDCELEYIPVAGATLHGQRPARLSPRRYSK
jgi:hypothetical protein